MFTQQHYIEIAKILKQHDFPQTIAQAKIVQDFVHMLEKDNKKFDAEKFLDTIYGKEEKV